MSDCPRLGKLFGGCKFTPRYDTVSGTSEPSIPAMVFHTGPSLRPTPARKTYLGDVCERCGKMLFKRRLVSPSERTAPANATPQASKTGSTR